MHEENMDKNFEPIEQLYLSQAFILFCAAKLRIPCRSDNSHL